MGFRKYDHIERLGHDYLDGLTIGAVHVFPKLDGTNASVWFEDGCNGREIRCGSRTRTLSAEADNAGFYQWCHLSGNALKLIDVMMRGGSDWTIYGEWLVPHTLKTYRQEAWRRFYVFDVYDNAKGKYLSYAEYATTIWKAGLDVIEPLCIFTNPSDEQLQREVEQNSYLIMDGAGSGEGVVLKNYAWQNQWGHQPWGKIVRNEFKEDNRRAFGTTEKQGKFQVEAAIAEQYVTQALVAKTRSKIVTELVNQDDLAGVIDLEGASEAEAYFAMRKGVEERHRGQVIPRLLGTVYHELIEEELWSAVKQHKDPTIDFKKLKAHCVLWTKKFAADLF
jgi:hypothetical protein